MFTLTALDAFAGEEAMIELEGEDGYLYYAYISVDAVVEGSELNLERTDVYLAPDETVEIPVTYQPDTAVLKTFLRENAKPYAEAAYDEDEQILRITAKEFLPEGDFIRLWVRLFDSNAETVLLAEQPIRIFIVENQLEVDEDASIEEFLVEAADKLKDLLQMGSSPKLTPEIKMLVTEVVNGLSEFTVEQLASHGEEIKDLEDQLLQVTGWNTDTSEADGVEEVEVMGAVLNLIYNGLSSGKISITNAEMPSGLSGSNMKALNMLELTTLRRMEKLRSFIRIL